MDDINSANASKTAGETPQDGEEQHSSRTQLCDSPVSSMENGSSNGSSTTRITMDRTVHTQVEFDELYLHSRNNSENTCRKKLTTYMEKLARKNCNRKALTSKTLEFFPFVKIMSSYRFPSWLISDVISGLTVGIMHLPQGMAYALLAGLPPIHGLYVSFFPVLTYFFFGTSRHTSIGAMAVVSLMVGTVVDRETASWSPISMDSNALNRSANASESSLSDVEDASLTKAKIEAATAVTLLVGAFQFGMGVTRLGFLTTYLSDPLTSGFTTGAACHVFTTQIKYVMGLTMGRFSDPLKLGKTYIYLFEHIAEVNLAEIGMSITCIVVLVLVKECINARFRSKMKIPVPIELLVVIVGTVVTYLTDLSSEYNIRIVGEIPRGIPAPRLPPTENLSSMIGDAFAIAIVAITISMSMAKLFAKKEQYDIDADQELIAYGLCNVTSCVFSGFACCVSMSRSLVQETAGGKTQVAGLVSSVLLLVILLAVGPLFRTLPRCILASIIVVALKGMFKQVMDIKKYWRCSKWDLLIWLSSFIGVVLLGVDIGLGCGVGMSIISVIIRTQSPKTRMLGRISGTDLFKDQKIYKASLAGPGVKVFRFESPLYYANAEIFKTRLFTETGINPVMIKRKEASLEMKKKQTSSIHCGLLKPNGKKKQQHCQVELLDVHVIHTPMDAVNKNDVKDTKDPYIINPDMKGIANTAVTSQNETVKSDLHSQEEASGNSVQSDSSSDAILDTIHHIILDCSAMSFVDAMGVKVMKQAVTEYNDVGIQVFLAECNGAVMQILNLTDFFESISKEIIFPSILDAVTAAVAK